MTQYSEEWWEARRGVVTASPILGICKGSRGAYLASRKNYMADKIIEILTGKQPDGFTSSAMQWGTDTEPLARAIYEAETGNIVKDVGLIRHPTIERLGASPDGVINDDITLEIKCPNTATHIEFLLNPVIKKDYIYQMNCQMMCTGATVCHFVSYDPRLPENLAYKMVEVNRDPVICKEIEEETKLFLMELDATIKALKELE